MTGEEWAARYCEIRGLDWDKLDLPDRRVITRAIPCHIRCWRVGVSVEIPAGEVCPECGRAPSKWDHLENDPLRAPGGPSEGG